MQTTSIASGTDAEVYTLPSMKMIQGQVTKHFPNRGFMFIQQDGDSTPIFAHVSAFVNSEDVDYITKGMRVQFRLTSGREGKPSAAHIIILWNNVYDYHSDLSRNNNNRPAIQDMIKKEVQEQCKLIRAEILKETLENLLGSISALLEKANDT